LNAWQGTWGGEPIQGYRHYVESALGETCRLPFEDAADGWILGGADFVGRIRPGTSKWNKIEHRVFCHITRNWQGVPLETYEIVVALIGGTTTESGLEIHVWLDESKYAKGRKVTDEELNTCVIVRNKFHGDWNYEIHPRKSRIR
jgi:hypothetical protein